MYKYLSILIILLITSETSFAHKISVFAWVEGNKVNIESKFSSGRKIKNGAITIVNSKGDIIHKAKTNKTGEHSFILKVKEKIKIFVDAGQGHKGYWEISKEEFDGSYVEASHKDHNTQDIKTVKQGADIREIVDSVVSTRLKPIQRELALLRKSKEPGFQDIAGAIGYIFGLMGVFLYFKYGRKE